MPWAFSSKTHRFENALESGSKRKCIHIRLFISYTSIGASVGVDRIGNGRKRIKMKTMTENIAGASVFSMRIEFNQKLLWGWKPLMIFWFNLCHNKQFYRFRYLLSVDSRKIIKTVLGTKIDWWGFDGNAHFWKRISGHVLDNSWQEKISSFTYSITQQGIKKEFPYMTLTLRHRANRYPKDNRG